MGHSINGRPAREDGISAWMSQKETKMWAGRRAKGREKARCRAHGELVDLAVRGVPPEPDEAAEGAPRRPWCSDGARRPVPCAAGATDRCRA